MGFFIPTEGLGLPPLLFLTAVYGYILMTCSQYMAEGCELLLDVFGPGVVGGVLLPILGAVPDGMMILMSGTGSGTREEIQKELSIGVGTLAGSTIMLLTIPFAVGVFLNRRQVGGREQRALSKERAVTRKVLNKITGVVETKRVTVLVPVLPRRFSWTHMGATALSTTPKGAVAMMLTAGCYLIIQLPALIYSSDADQGAKHESRFALVGFVAAAISFVCYTYWSVTDGDAVEVVREKQRRLVDTWTTVDGYANIARVLKGGTDPFADADALFLLFDTDKNGVIDFSEMCRGWESIGYSFDGDQARASFNLVDGDGDGEITRSEFANWIEDYLLPQYLAAQPGSPDSIATAVDASGTPHVPASLPASVRKQLQSFLADNAATTLKLTLGQATRYQVHAWAASVNAAAAAARSSGVRAHLPAYELFTHAHDASAEAIVAAVTAASPREATTSITASAALGASAGSAGHTRHIDVIKGSHEHSCISHRPPRQPVQRGLPAWACASPALAAFFRTHTSATAEALRMSYKVLAEQDKLVFDKLYASRLARGSAPVELAPFLAFVRDFDLCLTVAQAKFLFYSFDSDLDCKLTKPEVRLLLLSLVEHHDNASAAPTPAEGRSPALEPSGHEDPGALAGAGAGEGVPLVRRGCSVNASDYGGSGAVMKGGADDEIDDDDDEKDEDMHSMTPQQKFRWALVYLTVGTTLVTVFADPMVNVIGAVGDSLGIPAFYVSFIVTPLVSNASEVISSLRFASKKSDVTMGLTLSSLYGAATMNNTFCLAIFLAIVYFQGLAWTYTAEVTAILAVTAGVGIVGLRQTIVMWQALLVLSLFPLSIALIYGLNKAGVT